MTKILFLALVLVPGALFANDGGHGEHAAGLDEHTLKTIIYQSINVGALIIGLIYFLRAPVAAFFKNKKEIFMQAAQKAQGARQAAEEERTQIQIRLNKLESTADESISRAKADALDLKNQLLAEAMAASKRIHEEAALAAKQETQRAITHLREEMIKESVALSRRQMDSVSADDQSRLQGNFVNNMQGAQR